MLGEESTRFEDIVIPAGTYAIFEIERCKYPTQTYAELRKRIAAEWLPSSDYILTDRPESVVTHWYRKPEKENRYVELWFPVKKKGD